MLMLAQHLSYGWFLSLSLTFQLTSSIAGIANPLPRALDQLKAFLVKMQDDESLKSTVLSASTADDVAKIAGSLGYEFSGDELLRQSGKKVGRVTVSKQETPGEYN